MSKFIRALAVVGKNDRERARKLGISLRSITRYRKGEFPPPIRNFMQYPDLLRALAEDAEEMQKKPAL